MTSFLKLQGCCPNGSWVDFLVEVEIAAALYIWSWRSHNRLAEDPGCRLSLNHDWMIVKDNWETHLIGVIIGVISYPVECWITVIFIFTSSKVR